MITFNRPLVLLETIRSLQAQSLPPERILIIDNGDLSLDFVGVNFKDDVRISLHRMGYNSGPAGAAAIGLQQLAAEGYDWIYWGDDNDPPPFPDAFERLFEGFSGLTSGEFGIIGSVGHKMNLRSGLLVRSTDEDIRGNGILEVDSIAGGQCMLIHRSVVEAKVLPDPDLFFGFEELDFCLSAKAAGVRIAVDKSLFLRCREYFKRIGLKEVGPHKYQESSIWRQYYSTRNLLWIFRKHGLLSAWLYHFSRSLLKLFYNFRHGLSYGIKSWKVISAGIVDGLLGRQGKRLRFLN